MTDDTSSNNTNLKYQFKSGTSTSNDSLTSFHSFYSNDDEESNGGASSSPSTNPHTVSGQNSVSTEQRVSSETTVVSASKPKHSSPTQRQQPPPPSSPHCACATNTATATATSTSTAHNTKSNNNSSTRPTAPPPIRAYKPIPLDPQARLRAIASKTCPSLVQKKQSAPRVFYNYNHQSNHNNQSRNTSSSSSTMTTSNHSVVHSNGGNPNRSSTPPSSNRSSSSTTTMPSTSISSTSYVPSFAHPNNPLMNSSNNNNNSSHDEHDETNATEQIIGEWKVVEVNSTLFTEQNGNHTPTSPPCERSLHAAALWNDQFLIFGGYDGQTRRNDFYSFHLKEHKWNLIIDNSGGGGTLPTPRDRHCAVAYNNSFYIFGGFDGISRVNDFYEFDFTTMMWKQIIASSAIGNDGLVGGGPPPSPRHSHSAVVYLDSMYVFGGYDGSYRSDFYEYNFLTNTWLNIPPVGRSPRARYRATSVTYKDKMILYGGHDGTRHLSDIHIFDFKSRSWNMIVDILGTPPLARDSHICAVHGNSMFIFGGSAGTAMNDMYELRLSSGKEDSETNTFVPMWNTVAVSGSISHRFCHVGAIYGGSFYVFGGYDGNSRLNDFMKFEFNFDDLSYTIPSSTLVKDMRSLVNNEMLSDVVFIVEGQPIHAHKLMLVRCNYFRAMLTGSMMESNLSTIHLEDVRYPIFLSILEYLYTDKLDIQVETAMELFAACDLFGIPRLQNMCEKELLQSINTENAATIFHAADELSATILRSKTLNFILKHFEEVSKSQAFEEMARHNVELVVEILRLR